MLQEGKNIYLYVTINDGHLTSKTQVWAKVEGPGGGGGGGRKPGGGSGLPPNFLSPQFRPPPPPSIPINGAGGGFPGVAFTPPNKPQVAVPARTPTLARPSANKVPTVRPVVTQKATTAAAVTTAAVVAATSPVSEASTAAVASTEASTEAATVATTAHPNETRNVTETALTPPTVTTQQPVQNNLILALVPIVVAAVFLTAAGVLACLFRKRLFSAKVKSKKVNSIVSNYLVCTFIVFDKILKK